MEVMLPSGKSPFAALRQFVRKKVQVERCELCSANLLAEHAHLLELNTGKLLCACEACSILFGDAQSARYRRLSRQIEFWPDFRLSDAQWESLHLPINLAFFVQSTRAGRILAIYPSPAGPTESLLSLEGWTQLVDENPVLAKLEQDVEALLVNRLAQTREYYRVPIDECYKLVGLIRGKWRGLTGGTEIWEEIGRFFTTLKERASKGSSCRI
jgi:hypothetical protein